MDVNLLVIAVVLIIEVVDVITVDHLLQIVIVGRLVDLSILKIAFTVTPEGLVLTS